MPCNSDYMAPRRDETLSQRICANVVYLLKALGQDVPDWACKGARDIYGSVQHTEEAVVLLCTMLRSLPKGDMNRIVYDGRNPQARALANFWDEHEEADKRREREEKACATKEKLSDEAEFERLKKKLGR